MKFFLILTLCVYSVYADISSDLEPFSDEIINAINALNTTWKAGKNFDGSSSVQMDELVSTQYNYLNYYKESADNRYPSNFDAREAWPNCTSIGKIYDQKNGYPSWIYTAVGTVADLICIKTGARIDVETTVDIMKRSSKFNNGFNGAHIVLALNYWSKNGIFTVESEKNSSCLSLSQKCQPNNVKLNRYFQVANQHFNHEDNIKTALMLNGPISAYMRVYSDFPSYKSGVYIRSSKKSVGIHDVKLIGWGTENGVNYWLAANSWGTEWGEKGLFKIQRNTQQFGDVPHSISTSLVPIDVLHDIPKSYDPDQLFYLV